MGSFIWITQIGPPMTFISTLRTFNIIGGLIASLCLLFWLARMRWDYWDVPRRLGWMALFLFCFTATYGTFEVKYLDTFFRVPMVSVSVLWALIAAFWPKRKTDLWSRKRRDDP